jgi:nitric oxide reductase subunit B
MTTDASSPQIEPQRRALVSRVWVQVAALVLLFGLAVLGFLGYRAYTSGPPIAAQVVTPAGRVVHRGGRDRRAGTVLA